MSPITSAAIRSAIPEYDGLPRVAGLDLPHSWEVWGPDDELGTLNHLTPEVVAAAAREATDGVVIGLNLPVDEPSPPLFGREPIRHELYAADRNTWDERLDAFYPQGSSQWDGLRHVRAREHGFYGGVELDPAAGSGSGAGDRRLGIDVWARHGIVGRGLLLDVAGHLARAGDPLACDTERALEPALLREVAVAQGVTPSTGDILLLHTGWPQGYAELPLERRRQLSSAPTFPGLHAGEETARLLWDWQVAALVTDLPAVEPVPGDPAVGSLHRRLLPLLGLPLGELFDLHALTDHCAATDRWTFLFTAAPMHLPGGCGSPANALALL